MVAASGSPITHELALSDLRHILWMVQRARSTMAENGWTDDVGQRVLTAISKHVWGPGCVVVPLAKLIGRIEANGGKVPAMDYYNFLIIAKRLSPEIALWVDMNEAYGFGREARQLPEPDLQAVIAGLGLEL